MRVFVTGAAGFLGRIIISEAKGQGHEVLACSRGASGEACVCWNSDPRVLAQVIADYSPDAFFHCAGSASVGQSVTAPYEDFQASVGTWATALEAIRLSKTNPVVVFPSSAAVYGNPPQLPVHEDSAIAPVSPYGWHKALCEQMAQAHAASFGTRLVTARIFSLFGPTQQRLLLWELFQQLAGGAAAVTLAGTGHESRDYLFEEDAAQALLRLAQVGSTGAPLIVNLAGGAEITVLELAKQLCVLVDASRPVHCLGQHRPGDPLRWCADVSRLRSLTSSLAQPDFFTSLQKTVRHWQSLAQSPLEPLATA